MSMGWFQGRRLEFNDTITYRCGWCAPQNPTASPQPASEGPYSGKVVDCTDAGLDDAQGVVSQVVERARISGYVLDPTRLKGR